MQLRLATDAEKVARDRVTFPEWGTRLTLEQYLEREAVLRGHPFSRGLRTWLLIEGDVVLASCETFDNGSRIGDEPGVTWSIASVYVEEQHRGRGHATRLMDGVAEQATRNGVQACVLFSDVGTRLYERSGFVAVGPDEDWVLSPLASDSPLPPHPVPLPYEGRGDSARALRITPTADQLDWAFARERLYARFLSRTAPVAHSATSGTAHATWAASFKDNELIILWLQPGAAGDTKAVLDAARAEAHRCGLGHVRMWALPGVAPPPDAAVQKRKDELPMWRACGRHQIDTWLEVQRALWV